MKDIKFLGSDGDFLLLEDSEGQRYRLLVDEAIRRASRGEIGQRLDEPSISPREIQEEIRVGRTVEEIVRASGATFEYVQKFAQPVLDELNHAVLNALAVRLEIAGDRFNEPTNREFGEIIKARLAASGAGIEKWSAMKAPNHGFFIYCEFELEGAPNKATWSYDPKRLSLSPENEIAIKLSSQDRLAAAAPRLWPVSKAPSNLTENLADTVDLTTVLPTGQQETLSSENQQDEPISETADLLEALRKRRSEREANQTQRSGGDPSESEVIELRPIEAVEAISESPEQEQLPQSAPPVQQAQSDLDPAPVSAPVTASEPTTVKRTRASIPSWDEIVFGTKTED
jgi:hypothetical protein